MLNRSTSAPIGYFALICTGRSSTRRHDSTNSSVLISPAPFLTLTLDPYYSSIGREGTFDGKPVPDNTRRTLNFSGGASVNMPVGQRGRLSGTLNRTSQLSRYVKYTAGIARPEPQAANDYWLGSLQFSWSL